MNIGAQSGLLAAFVSAAIALSVLLRGRKPLPNRLFLLFALNLFVHFMASFLHRFSGVETWFRVDLAAASALPATALLFFAHFLWKDSAHLRFLIRMVFALSLLVMLAAATPLGRYHATAVVCIVYVFAGLYLCVWLTHVRLSELSSRRERTRLRMLQFSMLAAVSIALLGVLPPPFSFLSAWGDLVSVFFLYFLSQSLLKFRLLDLQELLGKGLVLIAIAVVLAAVFGVLVMLAGGSPAVSLFHTFVVGFIILILFEPLRDKVESSAGLLLFRERYEIRRKLEELRREIANIIDLQKMASAMMDTIYENFRFNGTSFYLREEFGASYVRLGWRGAEPPPRLEVSAHRDFFEQLKKTPTVILAETFERVLVEQEPLSGEDPPEVRHARQVLATLGHLRAGMCVPLVGHKEIVGLWNVLDESGTASYSTEEIERFMAVAEQAAITVENSKLFARMRERDRLAVLGQMAAGLAHEIRNPLGAIKGAAQYLDPAVTGPEASEFLRIIIDEADRLNKVVDQFLDYARPFKAPLQPTDLNKVVEQAAAAFLAARGDALKVKLELASPSPQVLANAQQLAQVLHNLFSNAADAMNGQGLIEVSTRIRSPTSFRESPTGMAELLVTDTGCGIPPEALDKVFVPFYTTKEKGTGLGLAISQKIIENHGGGIFIRSTPGKGTTFVISIPLCP